MLPIRSHVALLLQTKLCDASVSASAAKGGATANKPISIKQRRIKNLPRRRRLRRSKVSAVPGWQPTAFAAGGLLLHAA